VEFRGIPIGKVVDLKLEFEEDNIKAQIPVIIEIEADRFFSPDEIVESENKFFFMERLVAMGLRAQLRQGNLLTGQQLVEFDFYPDDPPKTVIMSGRYPELPTKPAAIEEIGSKLNRILNRIDKLPIEEIGADMSVAIKSAKKVIGAEELRQAIENLNLSLEEMRRLMQALNQDVAPQITATLAATQAAIAVAESTLDPGSTLQERATIALDEVAAAARSLKLLMDYLERHPEALLQGKGKRN
jgi:paraquat-inducible protein B